VHPGNQRGGAADRGRPAALGSVAGRVPARRQPPAGPGPGRNGAVTRVGGRRQDPGLGTASSQRTPRAGAAAITAAPAEEAFSIADPDEDRPWSRFLNRDRFDTFRIATYLKAGKFDEAQQTAADLLARLSPAEGKRAAVIRENIAVAHLARGQVTEAARV